MSVRRFCENIIGRLLLTGFKKTNVEGQEKKFFYLMGYSFAKRQTWKSDIEPPFYFKINRDAEYTVSCVQGWIDIAHEMGRNFVFVCDNKLLEYKIITKCQFYEENIVFFSSIGKELNDIVRNLCTGNWSNATHAHLTPFYDAKRLKIARFWNIDADDTTIALSTKRTAELLKNVEKKANEEGIEAFSLDMHNSKSFGVNWTLGVLYINNKSDFCKIFENVTDLSWGDWILEKYDDYLNLDWFITSLQRKSIINIKSFYINDCFFIHWGDFLRNPLNCGVYFWHNKNLYFPLVCLLYGNKAMGKLEIKNSIEVEFNSTLQESIEYFRESLIRNDIKTNRAFRELSKGEQYWDDSIKMNVIDSCINL